MGVLGSAAHGATTNEPKATATNAVTLDALVGEALENNPELNFYRAEIIAAKAGRKTAGLLPNPELSGSVGHKTARDRSSSLSAEGVAWSASVMQPFEWPGRIGLRKAIANREIELADLGYERFKIALAARMRVLAYGLADRHYRLGAVQVSTYVELQKQYLEAVEGLLDTKNEALEAAQNLELLTGLTPPLTSTTAKEEEK